MGERVSGEPVSRKVAERTAKFDNDAKVADLLAKPADTNLKDDVTSKFRA